MAKKKKSAPEPVSYTIESCTFDISGPLGNAECKLDPITYSSEDLKDPTTKYEGKAIEGGSLNDAKNALKAINYIKKIIETFKPDKVPEGLKKFLSELETQVKNQNLAYAEEKISIKLPGKQQLEITVKQSELKDPTKYNEVVSTLKESDVSNLENIDSGVKLIEKLRKIKENFDDKSEVAKKLDEAIETVGKARTGKEKTQKNTAESTPKKPKKQQPEAEATSLTAQEGANAYNPSRLQRYSESVVGINLNSMTSTALTAYATKLKSEIQTLQNQQAAGTITKDGKQSLKQKQNALNAVTQQNARLIKFFNGLKKIGLDFGSIKGYSVDSLATAVQVKIGNDNSIQAQQARKMVNQYKNSSATIFGVDTGWKAVVLGGTKLVGVGLMSGAAAATVIGSLRAIGGIKLSPDQIAKLGGNYAEAKNVNDVINTFLKSNGLGFLKPALIVGALGAAAFFAANKFQKKFVNDKNMAISDAAQFQLEDENKAVEEHNKEVAQNKNVTLDSQASRAEIDPQYLNTLKELLGGKDPDAIIAAGPIQNRAEVYNAARIIKKVQQRAAKEMQAAQAEKGNSETERASE